MKGGKQGRKRRNSSGGAGRKGSGRGSAPKESAKRQWRAAPRKGGKEKPEYGGFRTSGDE